MFGLFDSHSVQAAPEAKTDAPAHRPRAEALLEVDAQIVHNEHGRRFQPGAGLKESFKDADFAPEMVILPAGEFWMGSAAGEGETAETPLHRVRIAAPFAAGKYPVAVSEYIAAVNAGGCAAPEWAEKGSSFNISTGDHDHYLKLGEALTGARHPIVGISWYDAKAYVSWLSAETGKTYRLLSEAEWEYASRAGGEGQYCFGNGIAELDAYAWHGWNSGGKMHAVGGKRPNAWGLHDMHGSVLEWCEDLWHADYDGAPADGTAWTAGESSSRVLRGGHWSNCAASLRCAQRVRDAAFMCGNTMGFRVARDLAG